jgi:hypothetical protein
MVQGLAGKQGRRLRGGELRGRSSTNPFATKVTDKGEAIGCYKWDWAPLCIAFATSSPRYNQPMTWIDAHILIWDLNNWATQGRPRAAKRSGG